jgi:hypothetical protein
MENTDDPPTKIEAALAENGSTTMKEKKATAVIEQELAHVEDGYDEEEMNFAEHLFALLDVEEYHDVFHWVSSGTAFCIRDRKGFESKVMAKHFASSTFPSFTRRMRRWGLRRVETSNQRSKGLWIFKCPYFQKGRLDLCKLMCDDRKMKKLMKKSVDRAHLAITRSQSNSLRADIDRQTASLLLPGHHAAASSILASSNPSTNHPFHYSNLPVSTHPFIHDVFAMSSASTLPPAAQLAITNSAAYAQTGLSTMNSLIFNELESRRNTEDLIRTQERINLINAELAVISGMRKRKEADLSLALRRSAQTSALSPIQGSPSKDSSAMSWDGSQH